MILSCMLCGFLHQSTQGGQNVNRWIDLLVVELPIDEDLPFCDISCKIRDGMCYIVVLSKNTITGIVRIGI